MSSTLKNVALGMVIVLTVQLTAVAVAYAVLPPWRKAWVLSRVDLLLDTRRLAHEEHLYVLPDKWVSRATLSEVSPSAISMTTKTLPEASRAVSNGVYLNNLALIHDSRSVAEQAARHRQAFAISDTELALGLRASTGFTPVRPAAFFFHDGRIYDRNRLPLPLLVAPGKDSRVVIVLHGRGSSKDAVMGAYADYSNGFGARWSAAGWSVYALDVNDGSESANISFPRLGLSATGADLAKVEDLLKFISEKHGPSAHVAIAGISYGARIAELSGLFFENVDGVISIGGSGRYDYFSSEFSMVSRQSGKLHPGQPNIGDFSSYEQWALSGGRVFQLLRNRKRLVLVSMGVADAGQWGESGQAKFFMLSKYLFRNDPLLRIRFFSGTHESNPEDEISVYMQMVSVEPDNVRR